MRQNLKSLRAREQNMFEWRQEPCQFRDITDKVSLPKVTRNQTKPLRLKRKHTRKNRHASGLNENGSIQPCVTRTGTPYRISCLRQQPSGVDRGCQIWPIRRYNRFWYTVMSFLKLISQAFARPLPQSPLVFFPLFRSLSFSLALHYLNAWNRLKTN